MFIPIEITTIEGTKQFLFEMKTRIENKDSRSRRKFKAFSDHYCSMLHIYILAINCKVESRPEQVVVLFPGARLQGDSLLRQCLIETKDDT